MLIKRPTKIMFAGLILTLFASWSIAEAGGKFKKASNQKVDNLINELSQAVSQGKRYQNIFEQNYNPRDSGCFNTTDTDSARRCTEKCSNMAERSAENSIGYSRKELTQKMQEITQQLNSLARNGNKEKIKINDAYKRLMANVYGGWQDYPFENEIKW